MHIARSRLSSFLVITAIFAEQFYFQTFFIWFIFLIIFDYKTLCKRIEWRGYLYFLRRNKHISPFLFVVPTRPWACNLTELDCLFPFRNDIGIVEAELYKYIWLCLHTYVPTLLMQAGYHQACFPYQGHFLYWIIPCFQSNFRVLSLFLYLYRANFFRLLVTCHCLCLLYLLFL